MNQDIKQENWTSDRVAVDPGERNRMSAYEIIAHGGLQEIHQLTLQLACLCGVVSDFIGFRSFHCAFFLSLLLNAIGNGEM